MARKGGVKDQSEVLRAVLETSPALTYDTHALNQMRDRRITRQDVRSALGTGSIVGVEIAYETEERWKIDGFDVDGDRLYVVIRALQLDGDTIIIITTFPPRERI